jgi:hypothetical protein
VTSLGRWLGVNGARIMLGLAGACMLAAQPAGAESFQVPPELWDRPRTGRAVLAVAAIRQALSALEASAEAKLTVHHPPGPEAAAQAEELRAWLVAHAVEPGRILLRGDLQSRQALQLEIGR